MISSVTQTELAASDICKPAYWRRNLESAVQFAGAITMALSENPTHFIEIDPHSALELPLKETASQLKKTHGEFLYNSALTRGRNAAITILNLIGSLFLHGHDEIAFKAIVEGNDKDTNSPPQLLLDLPSYLWDYSSPSLWNEPRVVTELRHHKYPRHDLLGSQVPGGSKAKTTWRNVVDVHEIPWLQDHRLGPSIVFAAAAYITMAIEAACQVHNI